MVETYDTEALRRSALDHLWMADMDWIRMAEEGDPPIIVEGKGVRVTDSNGKRWIDVNGGLASVNLGYGRTEIAETMRKQMERLAYFAQGTITEPTVRLVEKLASITPGNLERSWLVSGGSEANEIALKIAKAYHHRRGEPGRYKIISRKQSYHGATGGVLWLGGSAASGRGDYEPAYPGVLHVPQPHPYRCEMGGATASECAERCASAVEDMIKEAGPETVAAVIGEPIAGAAMVPGDEYWPMVREICDRYGVLLIADEVVTGFGRTGKWFGMEHWNVVPDIMTVAKGLVSSYLPVAAAIATRDVADAFAGQDGVFRSALTAGGHPVTSAVALRNIELIEEDDLVANSAETGAYFLDQLRGLQDEHPMIGEVRGRGMMMGVELVADRESKEPLSPEARVADKLTEALREEGLLLRPRGSVISIAPPLCIQPGEVDEIVTGLDRAFGVAGKQLGLGG